MTIFVVVDVEAEGERDWNDGDVYSFCFEVGLNSYKTGVVI